MRGTRTEEADPQEAEWKRTTFLPCLHAFPQCVGRCVANKHGNENENENWQIVTNEAKNIIAYYSSISLFFDEKLPKYIRHRLKYATCRPTTSGSTCSSLYSRGMNLGRKRSKFGRNLPTTLSEVIEIGINRAHKELFELLIACHLWEFERPCLPLRLLLSRGVTPYNIS